jgi:hypothetical protein
MTSYLFTSLFSKLLEARFAPVADSFRGSYRFLTRRRTRSEVRTGGDSRFEPGGGIVSGFDVNEKTDIRVRVSFIEKRKEKERLESVPIVSQRATDPSGRVVELLVVPSGHGAVGATGDDGADLLARDLVVVERHASRRLLQRSVLVEVHLPLDAKTACFPRGGKPPRESGKGVLLAYSAVLFTRCRRWSRRLAVIGGGGSGLVVGFEPEADGVSNRVTESSRGSNGIRNWWRRRTRLGSGTVGGRGFDPDGGNVSGFEPESDHRNETSCSLPSTSPENNSPNSSRSTDV